MSEIAVTNAITRDFLDAFDRCRASVFFVQVGSNDGEHDDPLRPFVQASAWSGVMVEPVPYVFDRLRRNYAHRADLSLVNVAVSNHDGSSSFYFLAESSEPLPEWYDQVGSFTLDTILDDWSEKMIPDLRDRIRSITVPCVTFESLCEQNAVTHIDVIHIDAEGHDYEIIKGVDLNRYRPAVVLYEHKHLGDTRRAACRELLQGHGYLTAEIGYDTLCVRQEVLEADMPTLGRAWQAAQDAPSWYE